ncbi:putative mitochondrial Mitochondrial ATP-dependent zinc metallopeptidase [Leptomonas pyrrhocoris]|uniref:Putative mitochondrial Mitochondrial ATP-dependent zinc metallopeptidase n=1 Tax=Leptomonas pyrrhocoris TaxID=157538 RepID=A0A0M9G2R7_LEPPY|nr:putative mitochondrial Mitochondrial ATP-dependent zinc metallopeptidase [Leptomonas pyrrhocoris]XP_015659669.1 putative mitochondrial Mitochondrial ATP-dependent zinc metallopeptidase [Leptomonas pyrrhocoris]KPA81229.1 putative mitochondrial Mitochondrial ATP-dependent zinc metallopeptidase [Leptomonas pyrrhocoris]KPA81230.1 putative mitochondrial Mitochondrial ATP-dependent zinc metallopeptidase [Leptomonas pyrrhocoris]|eukprot:XP_015659668.1 putative mitochondrial Mitochondrial ATP-dependent zinc metallopeptidase [Leptomonas pyrrhocoris]
MRRYLGAVQLTVNRRTTVVRFKPRLFSQRQVTVVLSPELLQKRSYYTNNGTYPPPPPPPQSYYQQPQWTPYNGGYQAPPPPLHQGGGMPYGQPETPFLGDLGTKERPVVVVSAPQKASWATRFWMFLLLGIGVSCFLSLIDEFSGRFQEGAPAAKTGFSRGGLSGMFGVAEVKPVDLNNLEVTFDSIRGCDEAKKELEEIVEFLKDPEKFHNLGGRLPKGALLAGPPGCGKTMLAKAIAKEAGVSFFYATGSEFDEMFVGVGARRVRDLFAAAKANSPALIFIDEIDALGGRRSRTDQGTSRMTLNQLLAEMDGFDSDETVIVLAATNTPESLDKALMRPGRLDTTITVDPPDMKGRAEVLQIYLDKIKADNTVNAMDIARGTTGFTGAELSNLVNLAAIRAAVLNKLKVTSEEIEYAKDRVMMGAESKKIIPEEERRVTAFHEGGHALSAILLKDDGADPVHKATIVPRGNGIMGLVQQQPEKDKYSQSKRQCLARLKVCLAGRVGEELLLGPEDITTGAGSDFQQATNMARHMVRQFGFSDTLGFVDYGTADSAEGAYMSDETKLKIEKEVHRLVEQAYVETKEMLLKHRPELEKIAENLLKYETLTGNDLEKILHGETLPERPPRFSAASDNKLSFPSRGGNIDTKDGHRTVPIS